jgi:hypothetical protein
VQPCEKQAQPHHALCQASLTLKSRKEKISSRHGKLDEDQSSTRAKKNSQLYLLLQAMPQNTPLKSRSGHATTENPSDDSTPLHDDVQHSEDNNLK